MIILDSTSKSLVAVLAGGISTTNPIFTVGYANTDGSTFTEVSADGALNGVTEVELVAAPASSNRRIIKWVTIYNADTAPVTVKVSLKNGANVRTIRKKTITIGDSLLLGIEEPSAAFSLSPADLPAATDAAQGAVRLATDTEAKAGTDTTRVITPANLDAVLDMRSPNRNIIINGAMEIAQRGTSFPAFAGGYTVDRWAVFEDSEAVITVTQDTDVPTFAQAGCTFAKSLKVDVTTADASIGAAQYCLIRQMIEGCNFRPLVGQTATLSFWVKAVKPGIYCVGFVNGVDRCYVVEYTINSASTWEKKVISIPFNYSGGTWNYTNGMGLNISWVVAIGSNYYTANPGVWENSGLFATSNQINGLDSTDNNFWLTGVRLEPGSVATPFEWRHYCEEFELCRPYYEMSSRHVFQASVAIPNSAGRVGFVQFVTPKRAAPSSIVVKGITNANTLANCDGGAETAANSGTPVGASIHGFEIVNNSTGSLSSANLKGLFCSWTADAEL